MSPDVASRAFDPFFTTKGQDGRVGAGPGHGLRHHHRSGRGGEPLLGGRPRDHGQGVLPGHAPTPPRSWCRKLRPTPIRGAGEVVLVVEDQDAVRARHRPPPAGQRLRRAGGGLGVGGHLHRRPPPHRSPPHRRGDAEDGRAGAGRRASWPNIAGLPVLYMSGYAPSMLGPHGALDDDVALVQKPFNEVTLLHGVHQAITAGVIGVTASEAAPAGGRPRRAATGDQPSRAARVHGVGGDHRGRGDDGSSTTTPSTWPSSI